MKKYIAHICSYRQWNESILPSLGFLHKKKSIYLGKLETPTEVHFCCPKDFNSIRGLILYDYILHVPVSYEQEAILKSRLRCLQEDK